MIRAEQKVPPYHLNLTCLFWMISFPVILRPFQSPVALAISLPNFLEIDLRGQSWGLVALTSLLVHLRFRADFTGAELVRMAQATGVCVMNLDAGWLDAKRPVLYFILLHCYLLAGATCVQVLWLSLKWALGHRFPVLSVSFPSVYLPPMISALNGEARTHNSFSHSNLSSPGTFIVWKGKTSHLFC